MTGYLAKAREMCPKEKDMIIGRPERFGFNDCLSLCLPIVADLMKRLDKLEKALAEIENNHFECDAGEACKAHNIAKEALKETK